MVTTPKYVKKGVQRKVPEKIPSPNYTSEESLEFIKRKDKDVNDKDIQKICKSVKVQLAKNFKDWRNKEKASESPSEICMSQKVKFHLNFTWQPAN